MSETCVFRLMEKNMTYKQIERIRSANNELDALKIKPDAQQICRLDENLSHFFGEYYKSPSLIVGVNLMYNNSSSTEEMLADIERIKSTLDGMVAQKSNYALANDILDIVDEGESVGTDYESRQKFIARAYFTYNDQIHFDSSIASIAKDSIARKGPLDFDFGETQTTVDDVVIESVISKLKQYADSILQDKKTTPQKKEKPSIAINNYNTNTNTNSQNVEVDISIEIENAKHQIEDACLLESQEKEVLEKIEELRQIIESKESKKNRWIKIKEFFKWVAEQGIQVASIVVPLLANAVK